MDENTLSKQIIDAAFEVHKKLGPGLLENIYQSAMECELELRGITYERQKPLQVFYKGKLLDVKYQLDFLVGGLVVVELKSVNELADIHEAQLITYLKLSGCKLGLLMNFNVVLMKQGIKRVVNGLPSIFDLSLVNESQIRFFVFLPSRSRDYCRDAPSRLTSYAHSSRC